MNVHDTMGAWHRMNRLEELCVYAIWDLEITDSEVGAMFANVSPIDLHDTACDIAARKLTGDVYDRIYVHAVAMRIDGDGPSRRGDV